MYKRATVEVTLHSENGALRMQFATGSVPRDAVGAKIGEAIDAELAKLLPPDMSAAERASLEAKIATLSGGLDMGAIADAVAPKKKRRKKAVG